jgi:adenylosuccinate synthase
VYRAVAGRVTLTGDGYLAGLLRQGPVVFEGAQGVLLDEWRGFHPYTTWSTTTFANAETLLRENQAADGATRLGVTRTYQTRHGPGPLPTEDPALGVTEPHNGSGHWQGPFRAGHLDAVALGYARRVTGGVDAVALTHLDTARRHEGRLRVCRGYRLGAGALTEIQPGPHQDGARPVYDPGAVAAADWPGIVTEILHAPVAVRSAGPAVTDKTVTGNLAADVAVRPPLARSR